MDTPLHEYTRYGDYDGVEKALRDSHDPNAIGLFSWSPVHEAAHNGEKEILSLLLNNKGDPNARDSLEGNTAVHYAAKNGHTDCLQVLLAKGGNPDITNNKGEKPVQLATPECRALLAERAMSAGEGGGSGRVGGRDDLNNNKNNNNSDGGMSSMDPKWSHIPLPDQPAMGFLHLSFEYHANKNSIKVRVWQVSDLLLPPPQVSMIHSIFVRSYLIPDPPQKTVRRTEEVRVWEPEMKVRDPVTTVTGVSHQHIFTPSSFKFSTPLIYTGVTPTIVQERSVQIEVMMTQRGSKRHFLIGMVHMPLKYAVKKLIREEFPLIPCMNHTIPSTMRVYSARDLQLESSLTGLRPSRSFRLSRSSSSGSEHSQDAVCNGVDEGVESCNGDRWSPGCSSAGGELEEVVAASNRCRDFVSLSLGGSPRDRGEGGDLTEVTVSSNSLASDSSSITVNSGEELNSSQQSDGLKEVRVISNDSPCHVVEIHEPKQSASENASPSSPRRSAFRSTKEPKSPQQLRSRMPMDEEARLERPTPKHLNIQRLSEGSDGSTDRDLPLISPASSRPETPCWDYYDLEEEVEDEDDIPHPLVLDPSLSLEAVRAMTSDHIPPHLHPTLVLEDDQEADPVV